MIIHHEGDLCACFISDIPYNESNLIANKKLFFDIRYRRSERKNFGKLIK